MHVLQDSDLSQIRAALCKLVVCLLTTLAPEIWQQQRPCCGCRPHAPLMLYAHTVWLKLCGSRCMAHIVWLALHSSLCLAQRACVKDAKRMLIQLTFLMPHKQIATADACSCKRAPRSQLLRVFAHALRADACMQCYRLGLTPTM